MLNSIPQQRNYEVVAELGHGAQGSVYLVKEEFSKEMFAAKVVSKTKKILFCLNYSD